MYSSYMVGVHFFFFFFAVSPLSVNSQGFFGGGIVVKCIFLLVIKIIQACCTEYEKVHERMKKDMKNLCIVLKNSTGSK